MPLLLLLLHPLPATATPTNLGLQQRRQQKVWREKCTTSQQEMAAKLVSVAEVAGRGEGQRKGRYRGVSGVAAADVDGVVLVLNGVACSEQRSLSCDLTRQNSLALASSASLSLPSPLALSLSLLAVSSINHLRFDTTSTTTTAMARSRCRRRCQPMKIHK